MGLEFAESQDATLGGFGPLGVRGCPRALVHCGVASMLSWHV